ncbi:MAG: hypothetical protein HFE04_00915 [Bacilli bacterium]|nr:hypothetical protein [Bacilli bacterium]
MKIPNFLKKKPKKEEYTQEPKTIDGIEVLDLEEKKPKISQEEKKENRTIIIILVVILLFALALPKITSWFKHSSIFSYTETVNEIIENKTVDGMLEIGKEEGSITAKKIKFYNFKKRTNNEISVVYLPETEVKEVNKYNIYIELYNSKKAIIYRTKFQSDTKLERKVPKSYNFKVLEDTYKDAKYAKVIIIKEEEWGKATNSLACTKQTTQGEYTLKEKVTYNFSELGLLNYKVSKKVEIESDTEEKNPFTKQIETESKMIDKTNVKDLSSNENSIEYTIELETFNAEKSNYEPLHTHGSIYRNVKLEEAYNGWVCE